MHVFEMSNKIKFKEDDLDDEDFNEGSSDEEYTEREKYLVKKYKAGKKKPAAESDEEQVLGFGASSEDEDSEKERFENDSDIVSDREDGGIPDAKAWGKTKSSFYNTNYVDQDYSSLSLREEESAQQEEEEARTIQMQLAKHLREADFSLDVFADGKSSKKTTKATEPSAAVSKVKADLSGLTRKQKVQLLAKDSPEFKGLVDELNVKIEESYNELEPIIEELRSKNVPTTHPICSFIRLKNQLHLTYATNITFYLLLKASQKSIKNHPILKRLVQLRELLGKLDEKYEEHIRPEVERLLEDLQEGKTIVFGSKEEKKKQQQPIKKKKLNVIKRMEEEEANLFGDNDNDDYEDDEEGRRIEREMEALLKKVKQNEADEELEDEMGDEEDESAGQEEMEQEDENDEDELAKKRKITYQMAKNKGLTPHRKKEQRNPRVKHREKFRKALIRRKGAVRTVRTELSRYSGEHSGIKATVRKGIQIK